MEAAGVEVVAVVSSYLIQALPFTRQALTIEMLGSGGGSSSGGGASSSGGWNDSGSGSGKSHPIVPSLANSYDPSRGQ